MEFTKAQKQAIELRNRNILVSAAAGSGKTATLTERIIRLLTDKETPADITSMLIVTYTRAAASELRTRISRELGKALSLDPSNTFLAKQLTSLGSADICTIDSYYLNLVRSNFQKLGISAKFRLAEETEILIMQNDIMNAVIERRYSSDVDFSTLADEITTARSEGMLADTLIGIYKKIIHIPGSTNYLRACANAYLNESCADFFSTDTGKNIRQSIKQNVEYLIKRCNTLIASMESDHSADAYAGAIASDLEFLEQFYKVICNKSYDESRAKIFDYVPQSLGKIGSKYKSTFTESVKDERDSIKKIIIDLKEKVLHVLPEDIPEICAKSAMLANKIADVLDDFISSYNEEKLSRSVCEFADLSKFAFKLLVNSDGTPTQLALEERVKYKHIFVDEFQDTDSIQDIIFNTISTGSNLFLVGDIKQSIYSFRGAEPAVFARYRKSYSPFESIPDNSDISTSIFMSENFRCSPNIISFTNAVCSYLFRESEGNGCGIGYVSQDDLISCRNKPYSEEKVKVVFLEKDNSAETDISCEYIISEIKDILENRTKCDGSKYIPKDIAILTRSNKENSKVANALAKAGIPYANSKGNDLFANSEVLLMFSLLSAADNPQRDIPLASVLRSPLFGFTLSELVKIKFGRINISLYDSLCEFADSDENDNALKVKCSNAISKINMYRNEAESMPVHIFMRFLWKETNALTYAGSDESSKNRSPAERRRNLRKFYEYARKYEASSYKGLHDFVEYVSQIISHDTEITDEDAITENTVQIMTVHKSKGLEFPVVFLFGAEKKSSNQDSSNNIIFYPNQSIGIAFKISDSTGLGQIDSPYRVALSNMVSQKSAEEEIRILYVALTRARDVLYVVASGKEGFSETSRKNATYKASIGGQSTVYEASSWLDKILLGLGGDLTNNSYQTITPNISANLTPSDLINEESAIDEQEVERIYESLKPSLQFKYPYSSNINIPAKVSVSRLYPELLNDSDDYSDILKKAESLETKTPRFMSDETNAAERGIATHLFLQFCDFSNISSDRNSITKEISRLIMQRFIPDNIGALIRIDEISKFASSELFKKILNAKELFREFRFNVFLPASDFSDIPQTKDALLNEKILVQGVIDLCFIGENNSLTLCDYKTDRIPAKFMKSKEDATLYLRERHIQQLRYYSKAIESMMGKAPDNVCIYSLCYGDALTIEL